MDVHKKIKLAEGLGGLLVPERYTYRERTEILVEQAKHFPAFRKVTDKGIETLIGAGAFIDLLNVQLHGENYFHQVDCDNIVFSSLTVEPIIPVIFQPGAMYE
jgi:hypothetical protein|tara:strand:- start:1112 stop:1420 length:309 start_codon:yes stop_codon:yes gene_type:complete